MSGVAALYNVPGTPEELNVWSFMHSAHHRDINATINKLAGALVIDDTLLDPVPVDANIQEWLLRHQTLHQQMDILLGIAGYDLYDVDWQDRGDLEGWIFLNANEHVLAANILDIG